MQAIRRLHSPLHCKCLRPNSIEYRPRFPLLLGSFMPVLKAPEDWRTPGRFARFEAATNSARFWSAPVLWRSCFAPPALLELYFFTVASAPRMFKTLEHFTLVVHAVGALGTARPTLAATSPAATSSVPVNPVRDDLFVEP